MSRLGAQALATALLCLCPAPAPAQTTAPPSEGETSPADAAPAQSTRVDIPAMADPASDNSGNPPASPPWLAEVSSGYARRDSGPSGAFAIAALNRRLGHMYARAAITGYRSIIEQSDTALPSTYVVGSLGTGGNFNNWVFDLWGAWGWQNYGDIQTLFGERTSTARHGSPYASLGFDAGRIIAVTRGLYLTPTIGVTYAHNRLLRPSPNADRWPDFESDEKTWTGTAAARLDKTFGSQQQHYIGLAASWHITNNGLSVLVPPMASPTGDFSTLHRPDGWGEIGANAGLRLTSGLRLEASVSRSVQALAGNSLTVSGGLRVAF